MTRPASRRRRTSSSSSMWRVLFLALGLLLVLVFLLFCLSPPPEKKTKHCVFRSVSSSTTHHNVVPNLLQRNKRQQQQHRIAILIPFAGDGIESVPPYFDLFCTAASGSAALVDFLIIHNGSLTHLQNLPSNVILIDLTSTQQMATALLRVTDRRNLSPKVQSTLQQVLTKQLQKYPYILVEYKPALGHVFQNYLVDYSHWGYSDLDIIFGDLPQWISEDELTQYDIVTYGYGDQDRVYLRGQFTFHKNIDKVNQAWRDCEYLSKLDERFAKLLSGENKHFSLESAEGCYSSAVLQRKDISVKYAVKAFTDVDKHDPAHLHGVYLGLQQQNSVVYKHGHAQDTGVLSTSWFQEESYRNSPLQWEVGEKELVVVNPDDKTKKKCMYWALEKYQTHICVPGLASTETIFLENGKLYKQSFEVSKFPNDIVTAPFFHFQEWKRFYRTTQLAACHREHVNACVLTKEGAIPLAGATSKSTILRPTSPLGLTKMSSTWKGDVRQLLPMRAYCLKSSARTFPPIPPASKCDLVAYWQDVELIELLSEAPAWKRLKHQEENSVTLAMTVQITSTEVSSPQMLKQLLDIVLASLENWNDAPCVLVMDVAGVTVEAKELIREVFLHDGRFDFCLVAAMFRTDYNMVSRNTLLNMARDVAPTRWTLSGLEVERGLVLSREARLFAQRSAEAYSESSGNVLLVPQFSATNNNDNEDDKDEDAPALSVTTLLEMEEANDQETTQATVVGPDRMDCGFCEDEENGSDDIFKLPYKFWFELTRRQVTGEFPGHDRLSKVAADLERFQQSLLGLLTSPQLDELQSINNSPILMIDNVGPTSDGTRTIELAREVEEFGGMQCYNGLLLSQLAALGYDVNVLPGAFAASTKSTRQSACRRLSQQNGTPGTSRCDGCFMFDKEQQEKILVAIAQDERVRPAKAALLWQAASE